MKLVIVESPAKAKTIEKFLGKDFRVESSYGHIRDLPGRANEIPEVYKDKKWARLGVDVENDFQPIYIVPADSKKRINELKKMVKQADELLLATDEDREGEAISWHLLEELKKELKPDIPVRRITFHEITKSAIQDALANPRTIDQQLVRAQESRRILDRLYGYELSPVLWKKVRTKLSAGRVQSVAVRLIVEREEERLAFKPSEYWDVEAVIQHGGAEFAATLTSVEGQRLANGKDFDPNTGQLKAGSKALALDKEAAEWIAKHAPGALPWTVAKVEKKETRRRPAPPFTTSTLQQAASSNLSMSPHQTMRVAQSLYEGVDLGGGEREGLITYMRTDSLTLSNQCLGEAGEYIEGKYGKDYYNGPRVYKTKSKSAQEAHEAIRPTHITRAPQMVARYLSKDEYRLYELIWKRTVACQMADAILDKTTVDLTAKAEGREHVFRANGSVVRFPGFLKVYGAEDRDTLLPDLAEGQPVGEAGKAEIKTEARQHITSPPARYTEASLVKKLEEEGIGRPSTYAPTIQTIQNRDYVTKKNGALIPTFVGMAVVELLRKHFQQYIDLKFTAKMEETLDEIAGGGREWVEFLRQFYHGNGSNGDGGLLKKIERELPEIDFPAIYIGDDPETGEPVTVRIGRRSIFVQRGEGGDGNRGTVPIDVLIDELDIAKALEFIRAGEKGDEPIGTHPETGENIYVLLGPFGPYIQLGETAAGGPKPKRVGLPKGMNMDDVDLEYALKLLSLPRELGTDPETGKPVTAGLGRFGPYVQCNRVYKSIKDEGLMFTITLDEALERLKEANKKPVLKELGEHPDSGLQLQVLKGRYGPYVTDGKVNATIPKDMEPEEVTMEQAVAFLAEAADKKKSGAKTTRKKSTAKKTAAKKSSSAKTAAKKTTAKKTVKRKSGG